VTASNSGAAQGAWDAPADALQRVRAAAARRALPYFHKDSYLSAVADAPLKASEKRTMTALLETVNPDGFTTVDRETVAVDTGQTVKTVTRHWQQARAAALLASKARFNSSSVHLATVPGSGAAFPQGWAVAPPLQGHFWTDTELAWWDSAASPDGKNAPWGDGHPPF
jgi:hypothetical protein